MLNSFYRSLGAYFALCTDPTESQYLSSPKSTQLSSPNVYKLSSPNVFIGDPSNMSSPTWLGIQSFIFTILLFKSDKIVIFTPLIYMEGLFSFVIYSVILAEAGIQILLSKIYFFFPSFSLTFIIIGLTYSKRYSI